MSKTFYRFNVKIKQKIIRYETCKDDTNTEIWNVANDGALNHPKPTP
jgi:hypothetical protein